MAWSDKHTPLIDDMVLDSLLDKVNAIDGDNRVSIVISDFDIATNDALPSSELESIDSVNLPLEILKDFAAMAAARCAARRGFPGN